MKKEKKLRCCLDKRREDIRINDSGVPFIILKVYYPH